MAATAGTGATARDMDGWITCNDYMLFMEFKAGDAKISGEKIRALKSACRCSGYMSLILWHNRLCPDNFQHMSVFYRGELIVDRRMINSGDAHSFVGRWARTLSAVTSCRITEDPQIKPADLDHILGFRLDRSVLG